MTETPTEIKTPAKTASQTGYVVLRQHESGRWEPVPVNSHPATSAEAAIRAVVAKLATSEQAGTFVAVPARSWQPVTVKTKTTTALVLEDAK